jgi:RNA polymerase sigma-70 factor, ECF subfamily
MSAGDTLSSGEALAHARHEWTDFQVGPETFASYLAERITGSASISRQRASELYLACACALGDPKAIAVFEQLYFDQVESVGARFQNKGLRSDDVRQNVRERLFLGTNQAPPGIATYSGEGELRAWVRVVATRVALNLTRGPDREQADEALLLQLPDIADDPELGFMKRLYRGEFDKSVTEAITTLSYRERNLLRLILVDHRSTIAVGTLYGVHRTTVKRWFEEMQTRLLAAIRASMKRRLRVSGSELESILRLVESGLELKLSRRPEIEAAVDAQAS